MTRRTKQFQCFYHPEFQTNSIDDFMYHLSSHQKITDNPHIDTKIPEVLTENGLIRKDLLL